MMNHPPGPATAIVDEDRPDSRVHLDDEYPAMAAPIQPADSPFEAVTTTRRRSAMQTVQALVGRHLQKQGMSARVLAERANVTYSMVLAALNKGSLPRKPSQRESLRVAMGVTPEVWAVAVAASGKESIDLGGDAPTLQQLVLRTILEQGLTELAFAIASGLAYPTILGVTRKGAIPRDETLATMTDALSLSSVEVSSAVERSRAVRREGTPPVPDPHSQSLAQLVANTARRNGQSLASFARLHELPYLAVMKLVGNGEPPEETEVLDRLAQALGLEADVFAAIVSRSREEREPADGADQESSAQTPLQAALRAVIQRKSMTMKAFAELSELSVLTATRLVKHGALPSRSTTHAKLARLLDLSEADYSELLQRSKAGTGTTPIGDEEFQHRETEEIQPQDGTTDALARRSTDEHELLALIGRLDERRRSALKAFLRTLV